MMPNHARVIEFLVSNPVKRTALPIGSEEIAAKLKLDKEEVTNILEDLLAFGYVEGFEIAGGVTATSHPTAAGRLWVHEHGKGARLKRYARWGSASLAAAATSYGVRDALHEALPALGGLISIAGGAITGMLVAFGAHNAD